MMPNNGGGGSDDSSGSGANGNSTTLKKGPWTAAEDAILIEYVRKHGEGNWNAVQKNSGLSRCGKSCRLRWANHLRPNLKKGSFSPEEERLILELHSKLGNKWARMAAQLPGRTDNEIKNYWNTRVKRRQRAGLPLYPNDIQRQASNFNHHQNNQHQHHFSNPHSRPSHSPSPQLSLSSSQHQKPNFMPQSSIFDPINFSTPMPLLSHHNTSPFLSTPGQGFKRFRDNNFGFSTPLSLPSPALPPSPMFNQTLFSSPNLQFSSSNYDFNPSPMGQNQFESNGVMNSSSSFIKTELPSFQSSMPNGTGAPSGINNDYKMSSFTRSSSGLLDAMLQESEAVGGREDGTREGMLPPHGGKVELNEFLRDAPSPRQVFNESTTPPLGSQRQWGLPSPTQSSAGLKLKREAPEDMNSVEDDDLSSLLDIIPTNMMVNDIYNEGGETPNGQSSGVTEEDIGLDLHQLPSSSLPVTTTATTTAFDVDWTDAAWSTVPEMC